MKKIEIWLVDGGIDTYPESEYRLKVNDNGSVLIVTKRNTYGPDDWVASYPLVNVRKWGAA